MQIASRQINATHATPLSLLLAGVLAICWTLSLFNHYIVHDVADRTQQVVIAAALLVVCTLGIAALWHRVLHPRWARLMSGQRVQLVSACVVFGAVLVVALPIEVRPVADLRSPEQRALDSTGIDARTVATLGADWVILTALLGCVGTLVLTRRPLQPRAVHPQLWLAYAAICAAGLGLYLTAFWPGIMIKDTMDQWWEIQQGRFGNWHPVLHTMTLWLITRVWFSPTAVAIVQIIVFSSIVGWWLAAWQRRGVPRGVVYLLLFLIALLPTNGIMVNMLVKDILYSIMFLLLTMLLVEIAFSKGELLQSNAFLIRLGIVAFFVIVYRHNGPPIAFVSLIALAFVYRRFRVRVLTLVCSVMALAMSINLVLLPFLRVGTSQPGLFWAPVHVIAAHTNNVSTMSAADKAALARFYPTLPWPYQCSVINDTIFDDQFDRFYFVDNRTEVVRLALELTRNNPMVTLDHFRCSSAFVWRITHPAPPEDFYYVVEQHSNGRPTTLAYPYDTSISIDRVATTSLFPDVTDMLTSLALRSLAPDQLVYFWRPAAPMYAFLFAGILGMIGSRNWRWAVVFIPTLLQSIIMAMLTPGQDFRFQYGVWLVGLVIAPVLLSGVFSGVAKQPNADDREAQDDPAPGTTGDYPAPSVLEERS